MAPPAPSLTAFDERVAAVVSRLRPGEVVSYGEIAEEVGVPRGARAVGGVMARSDGLPWWRVVAADGRLVPGHEAEQARRLRAEGVRVNGGRVAGMRERGATRTPRPARR